MRPACPPHRCTRFASIRATARLLFAAHERGIHVSIDGGASWSPLNLNMPNVPVDDIVIHPRENDLIAGTHGRSIWILDNISSLEALTPDSMRTEAFLVPPPRARLLSIYNPQAWYGAGEYFAPNPDFNATIDYYLRASAPEEATITVTDTRGMVDPRVEGIEPRGPEPGVLGSADGAAGRR